MFAREWRPTEAMGCIAGPPGRRFDLSELIGIKTGYYDSGTKNRPCS
jgi:hypothetical protein